MGAFIVLDVGFERVSDRKRFEKLYKIAKKDILVDETSNSYGFVAYQFTRDVFLNPVYFMGFMGYAEPEIILRDCLRKKIRIKFMAWIPINDKKSEWEKIRGRW